MEYEIKNMHPGRQTKESKIVGKYWKLGINCSCDPDIRRLYGSQYAFLPKMHNRRKLRFHINYTHADPNNWALDQMGSGDGHVFNIGLQVNEESENNINQTNSNSNEEIDEINNNDEIKEEE